MGSLKQCRSCAQAQWLRGSVGLVPLAARPKLDRRPSMIPAPSPPMAAASAARSASASSTACPPVGFYYCSQSRRASGAGPYAVLNVRPDRFEWISGAV